MNKTGYPSIDKPHEKYYKIPSRKLDKEKTIYDFVFDANEKTMDYPAIEYQGKIWTFQEMKELTDQLADSFHKQGLKEGDIIVVSTINTPEVVFILLAANKLGITTKWIDVRTSLEDLNKYLSENGVKLGFLFEDILIDHPELKIPNNLDKLISINPVELLSPIVQIGYKLKNQLIKRNYKIKDDRLISFMDFLKLGSKDSLTPKVEYDKDRVTIMVQSSGTTGKPKIVQHTDYSVTSSAEKINHCDIPIAPGKIILNILPPWIAYSLGQALITSFANGIKVIFVPTLNPDDVLNHIGEFNLCYATPLHYRYMMDNYKSLKAKNKFQGIERVETFVSGGDKLTIEENQSFEDLFQKPLVNGYGNNEAFGAISVNPIYNNKYGTVGIPEYGDVIIAYDNENEEELPYNTEGEICVLTDSVFRGYENSPEGTSEALKLHKDGKLWLHMGDLGSIDEEGYIKLTGRLQRIIIRRAFKISASSIEDKLIKHSNINECIVVAAPDKEDSEVPYAFITLKDNQNIDEALEDIKEYSKNNLKEYEVPKYFKVLSEMPYTGNNKYDFKKLEKVASEEILNN